MYMYDLIVKKRDGGCLSEKEIAFLVEGYESGDITDAQMAAMLMAIYWHGLTLEETLALTLAMARSGKEVDLSTIKGTKVDKHSTGGVGDKTTLIVAPLVASCGVKVPKLSGCALGHTGGTIDKLNSIPGLQTNLTVERFKQIVQNVGCAISAQTDDFTPADKKMYALRNITATVSHVSLIASSVMSKKLALTTDGILLDVKCGNGAFMKTSPQAIELAKTMVAIGNAAGRRTRAIISSMDAPLGFAVGNALEIWEVWNVLQGKGPRDLTELCIELAAQMLYLAGHSELVTCRQQAREGLFSGRAREKFLEMVAAQGGNIEIFTGKAAFPEAPYCSDLTAPQSGYLTIVDTEALGRAVMLLSINREKIQNPIDDTAGIYLRQKTGAYVTKGDPLLTLYSAEKKWPTEVMDLLQQAFAFHSAPPQLTPLLLAQIDERGKVFDCPALD